jgi:hypothetical protein
MIPMFVDGSQINGTVDSTVDDDEQLSLVEM